MDDLTTLTRNLRDTADTQANLLRRSTELLELIEGHTRPTEQEADYFCERLRSLMDGKQHSVTFFPHEIMQGRSLNDTFQLGGALIGTDVRDVAPALRPSSVTAAVGANIISVASNQAAPFISTGTIAYWLPPGIPVPESTPAFRSAEVTPRRLAAMVRCSKQLLIQGGVRAMESIRADITAAISQAIDLGVFSGVGGAEPLGLCLNPEIPTGATFGGAATSAKVIGIP